MLLPSLTSLQISCQGRRGACAALRCTGCFRRWSRMFGIQGYHLLRVFVGLLRYEKLYLNIPLKTPTYRLILPITKVLQAPIRLKPGLTLITEINCEFTRSKVQGGAVLRYKTRSEHTANTTVHEGTAEQARVQRDQLQKEPAVCMLAPTFHTASPAPAKRGNTVPRAPLPSTPLLLQQSGAAAIRRLCWILRIFIPVWAQALHSHVNYHTLKIL